MPNYLGLLCLLAVSCVYGQNRPQEYTVRQYTMEQGLPSDAVYEIKQDRDGYLWMSTVAGLCRYDGFTFREYTDSHIRAEDMPWLFNYYGEIYVLTWSGKLGYVKNDSLHSFPPRYTRMGIRHFLRDREGGYWIEVSATGFMHIYGRRVDKLNAPNARLYEDKNGRIYTYVNGFSYYDPTEKRFVITRKRSDNIYEYSILGGMVCLTEKSGRFTIYEDMDFRRVRMRFDLLLDENGKPMAPLHLLKRNNNAYWVQDCKNLSVYDSLGVLRENITAWIPEKKLRINTFFVDREENVWIGTQGQGLFLLEKKPVKNDFPVNDAYISQLAGNSKGDLAMTHSDGKVSLIDRRGGYHTYLLPGSVQNMFYGLLVRRDNFLGVWGKRLFFTDDHYRMHSFGHPAFSKNIVETAADRYIQGGSPEEAAGIYTAQRGADGDLWIGCNRGLYIFPADSIPSVGYRSVHDFGIYDVVYGEKGWEMPKDVCRWVKVYKVDIKGDAESSDTYVNQLVADPRGLMWIATQCEGLYMYRNGVFHHFTKADGLLSDNINALHLDKKNRLWVCSNKGVTGIGSNGSLRYITTDDGIRSNRVNGAYVSDDDRLYLGTAKGLSMLDLNGGESFVPYAPVRSRLEVNDSVYPLRDSSLQLSYRENNLKLEYISVSFGHELRYAYFVEGLSRDWEITESRSLRLPGLAPGNYRVKIKALGRDGRESPEVTLLRFSVAAPFWQRTDFWLAVALLLGIGVYLAGYYRRKQLMKRLQLRERINDLEKKALLSQINPHFVFNCLTAIKYLLGEREIEKTEAYIQKFAVLMRDTLDFSESRLISLREETDYIENYLALEELRFGQSFGYKIETEETLRPDDCFLPPMLLQPYIENAIRHGLRPKKEAGRLLIRFYAEAGYLYVLIDDNGIGRTEAARLKAKNTIRYQSKGMHISSQRASLQHIDIHIIDKQTADGQASGTRIVLKIPQT